MDSIRDLSSHLPRRRHEHPQDLLSDFKAAALSVTNLYKSADAAQKKSRAAGYQDALDDLLAFLDKEDIGLMDGEGWRVRQWATARLDDDSSGQRQQQATTSDTEADAERDEEDTNTRSSSPEVQRKMHVPASSDPSEDATEQRRVVSEPPAPQLQQQQRASTPTSAPRTEFTFRSNQSYPSNHERESGMELDNSTAASTPSAPSTTGEPPIRVVSRPNRARHAHRHRESGNRAANGPTINFNLGSGAGNKRKIPYPDFFDISGIDFNNQDNRRDGRGGNSGGGGGKRGRFV
ncbi:hypothetical protein D0865_14181 [Hortaea werneckii]|uniref:Uncharacterized protein n=1 Tax=Hortaea werneckii TaxID=91943 RepID=A0A3M7D798_HORWE|nr:hypothetical protein D0865_14181 [Hortaea werneckii]RMY60164.1 hypothetical protein D0863_11696 [Hortaea werneckii]